MRPFRLYADHKRGPPILLKPAILAQRRQRGVTKPSVPYWGLHKRYESSAPPDRLLGSLPASLPVCTRAFPLGWWLWHRWAPLCRDANDR
jgi:hypothetical protein